MDQGQSTANSRQELSPEQIDFKENRCNQERCIRIVAVLLFLTTAIFLILFLVYYFENKNKEDKMDKMEREPKTCNTPDCLKLAISISASLDSSADPCENFYDFACGKFNQSYPLTLDNNERSPFAEVRADMKNALRDLLETPDDKAPDAIQKARTFYSSCLNTDAMDKSGIQPLLNQIYSGNTDVFPTLDGSSWVDHNWTLNQILTRVPRFPVFHKIAYMESIPLIPMGISIDQNKSDTHIIYFTQTILPFDLRDAFLGPRYSNFLKCLQIMYTGMAIVLKANKTVAFADAKAVVDFEIQVANATGSKLSRRNWAKLYNKMTVQQLQQRYPQLNWLEFIRHEFSSVGINVTSDTEVMIDALDYYDKIMPIISATPRRTLLNYCVWRMLFEYVDFGPKPIRDIRTYCQKLKSGPETEKARGPKVLSLVLSPGIRVPERSRVCMDYTVRLFPEAVGRLYIDKHFSNKKRAKVESMIKDLKDAFKDIVRETSWMSDQTKQAAIFKVDTIADKIGYSDKLKNDTYLNVSMTNLVINATAALENAVNAGAHWYNQQLRLLGRPVNRYEWSASPATVNAFYNPYTNSITFPAGFLQTPVYNNIENLDVVTYGAVGFFIGHEITHGFDDTGADFDPNGNLRVWWHKDDVQRFDNLGNCLADQYSQYIYPIANKPVDGRLTLGENIADNGGLKEAYRAYKKLMAKKKEEEPGLPGLKYSSDQLFFIAAGQLWCQNFPETSAASHLLDEHAPNRLRVIGPMRNNKDFAKAFNCKEGSYMNPKEKCQVW